MSTRCLVLLIASIALTGVAGCGNGLSSVSGSVTLDGQPIIGGPDKYGTVSFYREGGGGAPGVAIIDSSGRYELKTGGQNGIEPGTYLVAISVKKVAPPVNQYALPQATLISPPRYGSIAQSGLHAEVKKGRNSIDFEMLSVTK
jgi:hypothetical protein